MSYGLRCTVCHDVFESRETWIVHLLTEAHQYPARHECLQWRRKERKCAVVIFSDKPMTNTAARLLKHFSMKELDTIVTDFVWWPERDKVGLMQFESRSTVKKVMRGLELGSKLQVSDCTVQLKEAISYLDLEWNGLICQGAVNVPNEDTENEDRKPKLLENGDLFKEEMDTDGGHGIEENSTPDLDLDLKEENELEDDMKMEVYDDTEDKDITAFEEGPVSLKSSKRAAAWLRRTASKFDDLCRTVEIPDTKYYQVLEVITSIRTILGVEYEVNMFNNLVLQLKNPGSDILLIHAMKKENPLEDVTLEQQLLEDERSRGILAGYRRLDGKFGPASSYFSPFSGLQFTITTNPLRKTEVQMSRLLEYFGTFHPCVKHLFSLIYVWAQAQRIHLGEMNIPRDIQHSNVPEPAALNWLVILFLCRAKVIPSVRQVYQWSKKPSTGDFNPNLAKEWRKKHKKFYRFLDGGPRFFRSVLVLLRDFFKLFNQLLSIKETLVLNPRDGEYFPWEKFLNGECKTKMSKQEVSALEKANENLENEEDPCNIYVVHPLNPAWRLSLCGKKMKKLTRIVRETCTRVTSLMKKYKKTERFQKELEVEKALLGKRLMTRKYEN